MYASVDNSTLSLDEFEAQVQADINTLYTSESWGLHINTDKCAVLRFSRGSRGTPLAYYTLNGHCLPTPTSHGDLGVIVDNSLKFHEHIDSLTQKVSGLCHSFLKSLVCQSPKLTLFPPYDPHPTCPWIRLVFMAYRIRWGHAKVRAHPETVDEASARPSEPLLFWGVERSWIVFYSRTVVKSRPHTVLEDFPW